MRFLPFAQLTIALLAALPAASAARWLAHRRWPRSRSDAALATLSLLTVIVTLAWTASAIDVADDWAAWNYAGFEATPGWPAYAAVNDAVRRSEADPRVAYEHTTAHEDTGTIRSFESLPLFSGASTLEGLYMQSTISSPFVFYIQSEISRIASCPLLPYHCGRLDAARAAEHLRLYNVSEVIVRTEAVRAELEDSPLFEVAAEIPPYRVLRISDADGSYVEALRYRPLVLEGEEWKANFFAWFKRPGSGEVPLVRSRTSGPEDASSMPADWPRVSELPDAIPRRPLSGTAEVVSELSAEEIRIRTTRPGRPLLVKVSYHPRWRAEGADGPWLASPSFMLLVPRREEVRLTYEPATADRWGRAFTVAGLLWLLLAALGGVLGRAGIRAAGHADDPADRTKRKSVHRLLDRVFARRSIWAPLLVTALVSGAVFVRWSWSDPWTLHRQGLELFHDGHYEQAEPFLLASIDAAPSSTAAHYSGYYHALSAYRRQRWGETLERFGEFLRDYPDSELRGEAHFRVAEALQRTNRIDDAAARFLYIIDEYPESAWAGYATERLTALMEAPAGAAIGAGTTPF